MSHQLIATCAFGLEAVVKRELQNLGIESKVIQPGWVSFAGDENAIVNANLQLRCADRIVIQVAEFAAPDFDALFETTQAIDWSRYIPKDGAFPVKGRSHKSQLSSVPACQRSVKRAIVESMKKNHACEELAEDNALYQVEVAIRDDIARLTLDTTGPSLHKRGYRKLVGEAPLKETLAAAMVLLSVWNPDRPLIDPFCGSGTIPIEAALIGLQIAPGIHREFPSEKWELFHDDLWSEKRNELEQVAAENQDNLSEKILATDIDAEVLSLARYHAKRAGVEQHIHFQQKAFDDLRSKKEYGCVITNPPYGERLKERDLTRFYQRIPQTLQRLPTWSHFILTALPRFEAVIQKSATRRRKLYNGRIECMYYQYLGPKPPSGFSTKESPDSPAKDASPEKDSPFSVENQEAAADSETTKPTAEPTSVFGGISAKTTEQAELFASRLKKRARHLRRWPGRGIHCYRIYEKDIPEIPLVVDLYEDCLHMVEFERPNDHDIAEHASWQELMCKTAAQTLGIEIQNVFLKAKNRQRQHTQHERVASEKKEIIVKEGGLQFLVNLSDYVDTGLFLDHRHTREMFRQESDQKRVLNLFGYTGSFSVYAADGGALSVVHVDSSNTYVEWAKRNMSINQFHGDHYSFKTMDVNEFLDELPEKPIFDLAIVDPPTFSNSKQTEQIWDVQKNHLELLVKVKKRMAVGGTLFFSTNFKRFKLDEQVESEFSFVREISKQTVPEDFRNKRIHRCWKLVI